MLPIHLAQAMLINLSKKLKPLNQKGQEVTGAYQYTK
jgi:hypothetical protein